MPKNINPQKCDLAQQETQINSKYNHVTTPTQISPWDKDSYIQAKFEEKIISEMLESVPDVQVTMLDSSSDTIPKQVSLGNAIYGSLTNGEIGNILHLLCDEDDPQKQDLLKQYLPVYIPCKFKSIETVVDGEKKIERGISQEFFDSASVMGFEISDLSITDYLSIDRKIKENIPEIFSKIAGLGAKNIQFFISLDEPINEINHLKSLYREMTDKYEKLLGVNLDDTSDPLKKWSYA